MNISVDRRTAEEILNAFWDGNLPVDISSIASRLGICVVRDFENTDPYSLIEFFVDKNGNAVVRHGERAARDHVAFRQALASVVQRVHARSLPTGMVSLTGAPVGDFVNYLLVPRPLPLILSVDPAGWLCQQCLITPRLARIVIEEEFDAKPRFYPGDTGKGFDEETRDMIQRMVAR